MYLQFRINTEPVTDALSADESAPSSCIENPQNQFVSPKNSKVAGHMILPTLCKNSSTGFHSSSAPYYFFNNVDPSTSVILTCTTIESSVIGKRVLKKATNFLQKYAVS